MRILFLAPQPFYRLRGMCIAQKKILENLTRDGYEVDLLTFPFGAGLEMPGLNIVRMPVIPGTRDVPIGPSLRKALYDCLLAVVLFYMLLTRRYTAVHACEESAFIAAFFKFFLDFRLVYDMDDILSFRLRDSGFLRSGILLALAEKVEAWAIRSCDAVLTNSPDTTRYAMRFRTGGVIFYDHVPNPETVRAYDPGTPGRGGAGRVKTVVYAGNLEPYQGIDLLLEAMALLVKLTPARCVVIGGEPAQISAYKNRARGLGLDGAVEWTGKLDLEETFSRLALADALVSPMVQNKAVPSKIYMYMASGRPIVCTDVASQARIPGHDGAVLVKPEAASLAAGLARVLEDPALAGRLSSAAFLAFRGILNKTDMASYLKRAYGV